MRVTMVMWFTCIVATTSVAGPFRAYLGSYGCPPGAAPAAHPRVITRRRCPDAHSGPSRTVIPTHCGQRSGDCGQLAI
jgi:hypothetical protein